MCQLSHNINTPVPNRYKKLKHDLKIGYVPISNHPRAASLLFTPLRWKASRAHFDMYKLAAAAAAAAFRNTWHFTWNLTHWWGVTRVQVCQQKALRGAEPSHAYSQRPLTHNTSITPTARFTQRQNVTNKRNKSVTACSKTTPVWLPRIRRGRGRRLLIIKYNWTIIHFAVISVSETVKSEPSAVFGFEYRAVIL